MKPAVWKPMEILSEKEQARLRESLSSLRGPVSESVRWVMEHRWGQLCAVAAHYAEDEPEEENWKDSELQWRRVKASADELLAALEALGDLAQAAPQFLPGFGAGFDLERDSYPVHHLRAFASACEEASRRNKVECNGARKTSIRNRKDGGLHEVRTPQLALLLTRLLGLLEGRPQVHAEQIAGAIHAWAFPKDRDRALGPRFTERAMKMVRAHRGTRTPPTE